MHVFKWFGIIFLWIFEDIATLFNSSRAVLTLDDLAQVLNHLYCVRSKWLNIGLELGVHITDLTNIEREANDDSTRLRRMLTLALNRQQVVTWRQICEALCNSVIGESVYAKRLEEELQRSTASTDTQLTRKLNSRGIISSIISTTSVSHPSFSAVYMYINNYVYPKLEERVYLWVIPYMYSLKFLRCESTLYRLCLTEYNIITTEYLTDLH